MRRPLASLLLLAVAALVAGCAPTHRLAEVDLGERTVAVMAVIPPADVISGPFPFTDRRVAAPGGVAHRRYEAARAARLRFEEAAGRVDVAEIIAARALTGAGHALGFYPFDDPDAADYILDVRLLDFRLHARSFDSPVILITETDVLLIERATGEVMWQRRVRDRQPAHGDAFGVADRLTPLRMTRLSSDEMAVGLEHLAVVAANRITRILQADYAGTRRAALR
jgi:hypothetical protein